LRHTFFPAQDLFQPGQQLFRTVRVNHHPQLPVHQSVAASVNAPSQHRNTARRSFKKHKTESLAGARHRKTVRKIVVIKLLGFRNLSGKHHLLLQPERLYKRLQPRPVTPIPYDHIDQIRMAHAELRHQRNDSVLPFVSLLSGQSPERHQYQLALQPVALDEIGRLGRLRVLVQMHWIGHQLYTTRLNPRPSYQLLSGEPADRNHQIDVACSPRANARQSSPGLETVNLYYELAASQTFEYRSNRKQIDVAAHHDIWS